MLWHCREPSTALTLGKKGGLTQACNTSSRTRRVYHGVVVAEAETVIYFAVDHLPRCWMTMLDASIFSVELQKQKSWSSSCHKFFATYFVLYTLSCVSFWVFKHTHRCDRSLSDRAYAYIVIGIDGRNGWASACIFLLFVISRLISNKYILSTWNLYIFSERDTLRSLIVVANPSVVCDVGAPYSGGWTFRQFFFTVR